jgi:hypothetical protein
VRWIEQLTSEQLQEKLNRLEAQFGMTSEAFYRGYVSGELGDTEEEMDWALLYEAAIRRKLVPPPDLDKLPRPDVSYTPTKATVLTPEMILEELARFEATYGISSAEHHKRFMAGQAGDSPEAMRWVWYFDAAVELGLLAPAA